jgi:glycosyltransferase involved in cell wall biosynthesis
LVDTPAATSAIGAAQRVETVKRRVLVIGALPPPFHGGSVVTQTLLTSPLADRYEIRHLDTTDSRGVENIGRFDAGNVWLALVHGLRFLSLLSRNRIDMVYLPVAQNTLGFLRDSLFLAPAVIRGIPLVLHFHSGNYGEFARTAPLPVRALIRTLLGRAQRAIVLGSALRPMLDGIVSGERIEVVPNCVPDRMPDARRAEHRNGPIRILFLGNLIPGKGYGELIQATGMLVDAGMDLELVLAGGGLADRARRKILSESRIPDRIRFTGPVDVAEKTVLLGEADLLALPSYYENEAHPLVILEAMAAGLPVVSTRYVAIPEMVNDGVTGLLVEPRDISGLAAALRRLAEDPTLRRRMGDAGRARYLEEFTVPQWVERMSQVFDRTWTEQTR